MDHTRILAAATSGLGETFQEGWNLEKYVALNADAVDPRLRLIEIAMGKGDWKQVRTQAEQLLAINPLIPAGHRFLAQAAEALGERSVAMEAHRTLLSLDPLDSAEHRYRLAKLLGRNKNCRKRGEKWCCRWKRRRAIERPYTLLLDIVERMDKAG